MDKQVFPPSCSLYKNTEAILHTFNIFTLQAFSMSLQTKSQSKSANQINDHTHACKQVVDLIGWREHPFWLPVCKDIEKVCILI